MALALSRDATCYGSSVRLSSAIILIDIMMGWMGAGTVEMVGREVPLYSHFSVTIIYMSGLGIHEWTCCPQSAPLPLPVLLQHP